LKTFVPRKEDQKTKLFGSAANQPNNSGCMGNNFGARPAQQNRAKTDFACYKCNNTGHYARNCPNSGGNVVA